MAAEVRRGRPDGLSRLHLGVDRKGTEGSSGKGTTSGVVHERRFSA